MPQPVRTLRAACFALAVAASLAFGAAQASASPGAVAVRAACDPDSCSYWCGGLGSCRGALCDCY